MLREIAFHIDPMVQSPNGWSPDELRRLTYRIAELLLFGLPQGFSPGGIAKLNISVADTKHPREYWKTDRIGNLQVDSRRFLAILAKSPTECDALLLLLLQNLIKENLSLTSEETARIDEAVANVVNSNFSLKIRLPRLSRIHPTRKLAVAVNRIIDQSGETWTAEIWYGKYEKFAEVIALAQNTHLYLATHEFALSKWVNNNHVFSLRTSGNRVSRRINVLPFLKAMR